MSNLNFNIRHIYENKPTGSPNNFANIDCPPDYARMAWAVLNQAGFSDKEIEETSAVSKKLLANPEIKYRHWVYILWSGRKLMGESFPYILAAPLQVNHLGLIGPAIQYASSLREAFDRVTLWSDRNEPINTFVRMKNLGTGPSYKTCVEGEYPLSGWTRTCFAISAGMLAIQICKSVLASNIDFRLIVNCEKPKGVSLNTIEDIFPGGIEFDYSMSAAWRVVIPAGLADADAPLADPARYAVLLSAFEQNCDPKEITIKQQVEAMQYTTTNILSADQVADRLHISRKVLERRLSDVGTTNKRIADEVAYVRYTEMRDHGITKSEITRKLGFVDARALKRLTDIFEN